MGVKIRLVENTSYWWIRIQRGYWAPDRRTSEWIPSDPVSWSEPIVGKYSSKDEAFFIVGTDEHYEKWRVKLLRKIPKIRRNKP